MNRKHQCLVLGLLVCPICSKGASECALEFSTHVSHRLITICKHYANPHSTTQCLLRKGKSWGKKVLDFGKHPQGAWTLYSVILNFGCASPWRAGHLRAGNVSSCTLSCLGFRLKGGLCPGRELASCAPHFLLKSMISFPM